MDIAVYQIDPDRDRNGVMFESYDRAVTAGRVDASIYRKVFEGPVEAEDLEEVYRIFNTDAPEESQARSMAVSDVVEVRDGESMESGFYYCDTVGFRKTEFEPEKTLDEDRKTIRVVLCEPDRPARIAEIGTKLEDLQQAVGGTIETYYPFEDEVCIVCNDEGKLNGMKPCRAIYSGDRIMDIVFGPFFICDCGTPEFGSLNAEQTERYMKMFELPERYFRAGGEICAVPYLPSADRERAR